MLLSDMIQMSSVSGATAIGPDTGLETRYSRLRPTGRTFGNWGTDNIWTTQPGDNPASSGAGNQDSRGPHELRPLREVERTIRLEGVVEQALSADDHALTRASTHHAPSFFRSYGQATQPADSLLRHDSFNAMSLPPSFAAGRNHSVNNGRNHDSVHGTTTSIAHDRASHKTLSKFSGSLAALSPNVQTTFDRSFDPHHYKIPDSAISSWSDGLTPSPSDDHGFNFSQAQHEQLQRGMREGFASTLDSSQGAAASVKLDWAKKSSAAPKADGTRVGFSFTPSSTASRPTVARMTSQFGTMSLSSEYRPNPARPTDQTTHESYVPTAILPGATVRTAANTSAYWADQAHAASSKPSNLDLTNTALLDEKSIYGESDPYTGNKWRSHSNYLDAHTSRIVMPGVLGDAPWQSSYFLNPRDGIPAYDQYGYSRTWESAMSPQYSPYAPRAYHHPNAHAMNGDLSTADGIQSALMYEFKTNAKSKRYELKDIYDHIAEFSGDQHGSRFIQTKLETANSDEKDRVFRELQPNVLPLMTDVFGNYVIQKFFEHGDQTHKKVLAHRMRGHVLSLSLQMYGCRVVQKALDHVLVDQQAHIVQELEGNVLKCVKDQNGNHVIQKAIERCPPHTIGFIIEAFRGHVLHLSIHPYGCRVIQRCLEHCDPLAKGAVMSELMDGIQGMISDSYGNYVVQNIVSKVEGPGKQRVLQIVLKGLETYSKHKFASNVVEKCLENADDRWRRDVLFVLMNDTQRRVDGESVLVAFLKDNYGNYVIQKLLDTLCVDDYLSFVNMLHPAVAHAKRSGCGKQILSIEKKMLKHPMTPHRSNATSPTGLAPQSYLPFAPQAYQHMPGGSTVLPHMHPQQHHGHVAFESKDVVPGANTKRSDVRAVASEGPNRSIA